MKKQKVAPAPGYGGSSPAVWHRVQYIARVRGVTPSYQDALAAAVMYYTNFQDIIGNPTLSGAVLRHDVKYLDDALAYPSLSLDQCGCWVTGYAVPVAGHAYEFSTTDACSLAIHNPDVDLDAEEHLRLRASRTLRKILRSAKYTDPKVAANWAGAATGEQGLPKFRQAWKVWLRGHDASAALTEADLDIIAEVLTVTPTHVLPPWVDGAVSGKTWKAVAVFMDASLADLAKTFATMAGLPDDTPLVEAATAVFHAKKLGTKLLKKSKTDKTGWAGLMPPQPKDSFKDLFFEESPELTAIYEDTPTTAKLPTYVTYEAVGTGNLATGTLNSVTFTTGDNGVANPIIHADKITLTKLEPQKSNELTVDVGGGRTLRFFATSDNRLDVEFTGGTDEDMTTRAALLLASVGALIEAKAPKNVVTHGPSLAKWLTDKIGVKLKVSEGVSPGVYYVTPAKLSWLESTYVVADPAEQNVEAIPFTDDSPEDAPSPAVPTSDAVSALNGVGVAVKFMPSYAKTHEVIAQKKPKKYVLPITLGAWTHLSDAINKGTVSLIAVLNAVQNLYTHAWETKDDSGYMKVPTWDKAKVALLTGAPSPQTEQEIADLLATHGVKVSIVSANTFFFHHAFNPTPALYPLALSTLGWNALVKKLTSGSVTYEEVAETVKKQYEEACSVATGQKQVEVPVWSSGNVTLFFAKPQKKFAKGGYIPGPKDSGWKGPDPSVTYVDEMAQYDTGAIDKKEEFLPASVYESITKAITDVETNGTLMESLMAGSPKLGTALYDLGVKVHIVPTSAPATVHSTGPTSLYATPSGWTTLEKAVAGGLVTAQQVANMVAANYAASAGADKGQYGIELAPEVAVLTKSYVMHWLVQMSPPDPPEKKPKKKPTFTFTNFPMAT